VFFLSLLVELVELYEERGAENEDMALTVQALQRLLAEEPSNEEAHVGLMRLYALSGRQGEALRQSIRGKRRAMPRAGRQIYGRRVSRRAGVCGRG
jgi:DNA-binding SARP family transcriptional activator